MSRTLSDFKLAVFAMDSVILENDGLIELADFVDQRSTAEAMTHAGLAGETANFQQNLLDRVALLAGTPATALREVWEHRLPIRKGARECCAHFKAEGLKLALITSGFSYFAERVASALGFDFVRSNELAVVDGQLTGQLLPRPWGQVCDGAAKLRMLRACYEVVGCSPAQAIVVGHGVNDLPMLAAAGIGVTFNAPDSVARHGLAIQADTLDAVATLLPTYGEWLRDNR